VFIKQTQVLGVQPKELAVFMKLARAFDKVARRNNISYFLYGGTLIGAYRNGSLLVRMVENSFFNFNSSLGMTILT